MELLKLFGSSFGNRLALAHINIGGQSDGTDSDDDAGASDVPVEVDVVGLSVGANEVSERYEASHAGDNGEEHQREGHGERCLMRRVLSMELLVFRAPEDSEVETEHIERGHGGDGGHDPAHKRTVGEAGGEDFVFREET